MVKRTASDIVSLKVVIADWFFMKLIIIKTIVRMVIKTLLIIIVIEPIADRLAASSEIPEPIILPTTIEVAPNIPIWLFDKLFFITVILLISS